MGILTELGVIGGRVVVDHERPVRSLEKHQLAGHLIVTAFQERCHRLGSPVLPGFQVVHHAPHLEKQRVGPAYFVVHPDFAKAALTPR